MSTPVYVVGVGMTQFGRHLERSLQSLADEALNVALTDAGAALNDIGQVFYSGVTQGALIGQTAIPGEVVLHKIGLVGLPVWNIENACASGTSAFQLAVQALRAGACDVALALGAEKMNIPDRSRALALFEGGWDVLTADENAALLLELGKGVEVPPGSESDRPYSRFMAIYAAQCRFWMKSFGTTQRQIAAVSAKNHNHSVHNPFSQYRQPFTIEEVLAAPPITYPLTLPMCSPLSDGAAAVIVCTEAGLKKLGVDRRRAIRVAATAIATATARAPDAFDQAVCRRAANAAYEQAGIGPAEVSVVEVHDASAMGEIMAVEYLGLVPMGGGGIAAEAGELSVGGRIPVNPSGGLECKGHPIGATGLGQIYELVTQLRGEAGARQVEGAKVALQENGGGSIGYEEAVVTVNLFTR
ncbi:TPA: thiolase family protein [Pseudomonas aeruginosa]|uniref:Thiolase family protein n=1 Tax=Pseudomonas nitroreducens TaxID=46680 RepID=A0A6G6IS24_PSENT|nr:MULTISPECIES: thiolase family protein [Pseudomonas aeruginosa group]KYO75106.1 3-ketoacyl-CoA thiolase [Pseudomonas aeruginosa]QIE85996.1 thiolase family protein [Pseudomonas nitroreducens]HCE6396353.1 thiolase family protein [Pseudomonas aeruginosa]